MIRTTRVQQLFIRKISDYAPHALKSVTVGKYIAMTSSRDSACSGAHVSDTACSGMFENIISVSRLPY